MNALEKVLSYLEKNSAMSRKNYHIPYCWNYVNADFEKSDREGEVTVDSIDYFSMCINKIINTKASKYNDDKIIYSMLIRTFSAWNHDTILESGTFLKTICLLPLLNEMGINTIYLLPVFELSEQNKKGELSSPYAIKNIMAFDKALSDDHLAGMSIDEQFSALCEAAHILGMRVILDFVFRTAARDSVLLAEHPDWFYWVTNHSLSDFKAPSCPELGHTPVNEKNVKALYRANEMIKFANCFCHSPEKRTIEILSGFEKENSTKVISEKLGISVMPGFADTINDIQPAWNDITFLKFFLDNTEQVKKKFGEKYPPMIAQDGVKCSVFEGEIKNEELWNYVSMVIPYYIKGFSIDGARIDMSHALPKELNKRIVKEIKKHDKKFILWSEEFDSSNTRELKEEGYSFFTGGIWDLWGENDFSSMNFNKRLNESISGEIPCVSCTEMADTPRSVQLLGQQKCISALIMTALLPNTAYLVNNGIEFSEKQPMNLGLKNNESGRYVLGKNHKYYGKLAFFDNYSFEWTNRKQIYSALKEALKLRNKFSDVINSIENYDMKLLKSSSLLSIICGFNGKHGYLLLFNRGTEEIKVYAKRSVPSQAVLGECIYGCENKDVLYPNSVIIYELYPKQNKKE